MEAQQKVTAETYRDDDRPPVIAMTGLLAGLCGFLAVIAWACGTTPFLRPYTGEWISQTFWLLVVIGVLFAVVCARNAYSFYGWRFGWLKVPPKHTIKAQLLRMLSEKEYLPQDVTKWKSRHFSVETDKEKCQAIVHVRGAVKKGLDELERDLNSLWFLVGKNHADVRPENDENWNDGFKIVIDYMTDEERGKEQDAIAREEWWQ